jgi:hypothetical protein
MERREDLKPANADRGKEQVALTATDSEAAGPEAESCCSD